MMPNVKRTTDQQQLQLLDDDGRVIGVISRPVEVDALGPGREKVYLQRRPPARSPRAA